MSSQPWVTSAGNRERARCFAMRGDVGSSVLRQQPDELTNRDEFPCRAPSDRHTSRTHCSSEIGFHDPINPDAMADENFDFSRPLR
jgi:hypothetical protein